MWRLRPRTDIGPSDDSGILELLGDDPKQGWDLFIERYADSIFGQLRGMGFDYDDAMERFVYIFEKLSEDNCRRLRSIRFAGQHGELVPWVRTVVKNLCVNWAWSQNGRRRLFKPIERLSELDQRVFELYFWRGFKPTEVEAQLRREAVFEVRTVDVFDALERIISNLSANRLWRLASNLLQARGAASFEALSEVAGVPIEAVDPGPDPENLVANTETLSWLDQELRVLEPRSRLVIQLHFEQALSLSEIDRALQLSKGEAKEILGASLESLRARAARVAPNLSVEMEP